MSSQIHTSNNFDFIAGKYQENFTFSTDKSLKKGSVFKQGGKAVGLVLNDITIDDEARPVAIMVAGIVYPDRLVATDDEKKSLLTDTSIRFLGGSLDAGTTSGTGTTETAVTGK